MVLKYVPIHYTATLYKPENKTKSRTKFQKTKGTCILSRIVMTVPRSVFLWGKTYL